MTTINLPQEKQEAPETEAETLMTVDEFERRYSNKPYELWEGRVVKVSPVGGLHGRVVSRIDHILRTFLENNQVDGEIFAGDVGFRLSTIILRAPDVAFVSQEKMALINDINKFLPFAPNLAIEVISPSERSTDVHKKLEFYTAAQTPLVWLVYEDDSRVVVYELDRPFRVVPLTGVLDGGMVLPGLQIKVADLFPARTASAKAKESRESKKPANPAKEG